jgi:hypothetical protein
VKRPAVVVGGALGIVLVLNGVALAYRSGQVATTATASATAAGGQLTFTLTGTSAAALYPGGPAGTVTVNLTNPFSRNVTVTGVTMALAPTGGIGTCDASDFTTSSANIPATVVPGTAGYAVSVSMSSTASNGCQGATIGLTVTVNGRL